MQFSYILMIKKKFRITAKNSSISSKQNESSETTKADFLNVGSLGLWLEPYKMTKIRHGAVCNGF